MIGMKVSAMVEQESSPGPLSETLNNMHHLLFIFMSIHFVSHDLFKMTTDTIF